MSGEATVCPYSIGSDNWPGLAKLAEEAGEVIAAYIGVTGQNPRKGVTHSLNDVSKELLDVAVTALAAFEHIGGNRGRTMQLLDAHLARLVDRAGLRAEIEALKDACTDYRRVGERAILERKAIRAERDAALARIRAVEQLHHEVPNPWWHEDSQPITDRFKPTECAHDYKPWPCPTAAALAAPTEDSDRG